MRRDALPKKYFPVTFGLMLPDASRAGVQTGILPELLMLPLIF